jgi:hypothetical protein
MLSRAAHQFALKFEMEKISEALKHIEFGKNWM